jgi:predicted nuclease of predicted toxin-antitoxin system
VKFFADHCVAESVCKFLEGRGHEVIRLRDVLPTDSPDPLVAKVAQDNDAVLLSHDGDFNAIASRVPVGAKSRFRKLSRVHLGCENVHTGKRIAEAIELIEFEYEGAKKRKEKRLHIVIQKAGIKTNR